MQCSGIQKCFLTVIADCECPGLWLLRTPIKADFPLWGSIETTTIGKTHSTLQLFSKSWCKRSNRGIKKSNWDAPRGFSETVSPRKTKKNLGNGIKKLLLTSKSTTELILRSTELTKSDYSWETLYISVQPLSRRENIWKLFFRFFRENKKNYFHISKKRENNIFSNYFFVKSRK